MVKPPIAPISLTDVLGASEKSVMKSSAPGTDR